VNANVDGALAEARLFDASLVRVDWTRLLEAARVCVSRARVLKITVV